MIRVHKGAQPKSLRDHAAHWTAELLGLLAAGQAVPVAVWSRYNQPDVKGQAVADSHSKCIYCESKVTHVSFGDLEHLKPKKRYPSSTFDWENLALVCSKCNNKKAGAYTEAMPPINPMSEEPGDFLVAYGNQIWARPGQDRGGETITLVDLNRAELLEQRRKRCEAIKHLAETIVRTVAPLAKAALVDQLHEELGDAGEYAFAARAIARSIGVFE